MQHHSGGEITAEQAYWIQRSFMVNTNQMYYEEEPEYASPQHASKHTPIPKLLWRLRGLVGIVLLLSWLLTPMKED